MIKKILLLLAISITLAYNVPHAQATAYSDLCQQLLSNMEDDPVGDFYVKKLLKRSKDGMDYIVSQWNSSDQTHLRRLPFWARIVLDEMLRALDSHLRVVHHGRDLNVNTACLRIDIFLLECRMDEIRDKMNKALDNREYAKIWSYRQLFKFLDDRIRVLAEGGRDPFYEDTDWHQLYSFDDPNIYSFAEPLEEYDEDKEPECGDMILDEGEECDDGNKEDEDDFCSNDCTNNICPFHSDYLPPSVSGFGCDASVMGGYVQHPPTKEEYQAFTEVEGQHHQFIQDVSQILGLQSVIHALLGRPAEEAGAPSVQRGHQIHSWRGCPKRACSGDRSSCVTNKDCTDRGAGSCLPNTQELDDTAWWELRGPFAIGKDEPKILNRFRELRIIEGENREEQEKDVKNKKSVFSILENGRLIIMRLFSRTQGEKESTIFAQPEAPLVIAKALTPLRDAVKEYAREVTKEERLRQWLVNLAFFAKRTCVYRPCSFLLEKILRMSFQMECFPHTLGAFLGDSCENPRARKCLKAAELDTKMGFNVDKFTKFECED